MDNEADPCRPEQYADPDVTGIGVLIAFGFSVLLTIVSVLLAYLLGALRPNRYNSADKLLLDTLYGFFGKEFEWPTSGGTRHLQRTAAFETFIQALADQNMFTGLALIVTTYRIQFDTHGLAAKVSTYTFCLAAGLLMPQLVASQALDTTYSLRCALELAPASQRLTWSTDGTEGLEPTLFFATLEAWLAECLQKFLHWPGNEMIRAYETQAARHEASLASKLESPGHASSLTVILIVFTTLRDSFFAEIIWLLFYVLFALFQIVYFFVFGLDIDRSSDVRVSLSMGFGQVLPLVLLGLPVLSSLELNLIRKYDAESLYNNSTTNNNDVVATVPETTSHIAPGSQDSARQNAQTSDNVNLF
ncbi:hypothetical protein F53441_11290 [Fusarium austroafricanum]|uniref:Uncharacterized protein n=1 Tax=Fusarium austroafricanum TaxID=2364996 RepID=A0A8H4P094_9HYPO|nr:hypothetical protein F53441_11290 [Fusarium austroafricanum]